MLFQFHPIDEASARDVATWRYDPPYDLYDPGADGVQELIDTFLEPRYAYYGIFDERRQLVAYCCFGPDARVPGGDYGPDALDIGLGVRPDLTGKGRGPEFVDAVLDFARRTFAPAAFRVTVAEFNNRARRVWQKAGFGQVQVFERPGDGMAFVVLTREA